MTKTAMAAVVAGCVALAGPVLAGEGCAMSKKSCAAMHASNKACGDKTASADCPGCNELATSGKTLKDAGADVEIVGTKGGVIVIATAAGADQVEKIRKLSADRWSAYQAIGGTEASKKLCKTCTAFEAALKSGGVKVQQVNVENGVMTVLTAANAEALAALKNGCTASCGLKTAEAPAEKATASN